MHEGKVLGPPFAARDEELLKNEDLRAEWARVARFINQPYVFCESEWEGLVVRPAVATATLSPQTAETEVLRRVLREELTQLLKASS